MKQLSTLASWHAEVAPNHPRGTRNFTKKPQKNGSGVASGCSISAKQTTKVPAPSRVRDAVRRELNVPKNSFEFARIRQPSRRAVTTGMSLSADVCASKADQFLISGCKPISRCSREMMLDKISNSIPFLMVIHSALRRFNPVHFSPPDIKVPSFDANLARYVGKPSCAYLLGICSITTQ
jgi:hypothetical protein